MSGARNRSHQWSGTQRWNEADARGALAALEASGQSMETFARAGGYSAQRLRWWRARLSESSRAPNVAAPSLLPVIVRTGSTTSASSSASSRAAVIVVLADGARLEIADPRAVDPRWIATIIAGVGGA